MGYNPTTNDPLRHNRMMRRRRDRRIDASATNAGTRPFRAVDKIKQQVELIAQLQDALEKVVSSITSVVIDEGTTSKANAGHTSWTTLVSCDVARPDNTTRASINAVGQLVVQQSIESDGMSADALQAARACQVDVRLNVGGTVVSQMRAAKSGSGDSYMFSVTISGMAALENIGASTTVELQVMASSTVGFDADGSATVSAYAIYTQ